MAASLPNNDDKKWLISEDDMPIDDFLMRNPPSQIEGSQYSYICVRHSDYSKIKSPDKASLRKECDSHRKLWRDYLRLHSTVGREIRLHNKKMADPPRKVGKEPTRF